MNGSRAQVEFELSGGALCLDFANTLGDRPRATNEHLRSYADLLRFSRQTGSLPVADLEILERLYVDNPTSARTIFQRVLAVRQAIYRLFSAAAGGALSSSS